MTQNVKYYTAPNFNTLDDSMLSVGFFTRLGGVSEGAINGLNCGFGSNDDPTKVSENRTRVANQNRVHVENLLSVYQVHGAEVINVTQPWSNENRPEADAMVTDKKDIALGIMTADCAPVLFFGTKEDETFVIGAAHAGWRGALSGVLENTVAAMLNLGASQDSLKACVGPCIARNSYEVRTDFVTPFLDEDEESERFFSSGAKPESLLFDLAGYCSWRLYRRGLKSVSLLDLDTYKNSDEFYSYRRATHNKEADYGRQISVISIK